MVVLGVDSGSLSTGYGFVEERGGRMTALAFGAIRNAGSVPHPDRLFKIQEELRALIKAHGPSLVALEDVFVAKNARSALILGQVRGVVMATAMTEGVPVREFTPNQVKMSLTGYGHADKPQIQHMVKVLLGLPAPPQPHDAADALALAVTALNRGGWESKVAASWGGTR
jgi:crossover junction endodeoxyribonuclease RuvC